MVAVTSRSSDSSERRDHELVGGADDLNPGDDDIARTRELMPDASVASVRNVERCRFRQKIHGQELALQAIVLARPASVQRRDVPDLHHGRVIEPDGPRSKSCEAKADGGAVVGNHQPRFHQRPIVRAARVRISGLPIEDIPALSPVVTLIDVNWSLSHLNHP